MAGSENMGGGGIGGRMSICLTLKRPAIPITPFRLPTYRVIRAIRVILRAYSCIAIISVQLGGEHRRLRSSERHPFIILIALLEGDSRVFNVD